MNDRERERVGRTSICCCRRGANIVEAVGEALAWTRQRWRWHGIEAGTWCGPGGGRGGIGVDPAVVGEVPAWTRRRWRRLSLEAGARRGPDGDQRGSRGGRYEDPVVTREVARRRGEHEGGEGAQWRGANGGKIWHLVGDLSIPPG
jgi:hypothetical protein